MNHLSFFTGIGGFDLAARRIGWTNIAQVEKDEDCQKVLDKQFPNTTKYHDIYDFPAEKYTDTIDLISGGFPCQPFSIAGHQAGTMDERYLWPIMCRHIQTIRPTWVVAENVANLTNISQSGDRSHLETTTIGFSKEDYLLPKIKADLEQAGFEVLLLHIPVSAVNGIHKRNRLWICAYSHENANRQSNKSKKGQSRQAIPTNSQIRSEWKTTFDTGLAHVLGLHTRTDWEQLQRDTKPTVDRSMDGLSKRLDKTRLEMLGNAIAPQIAYIIFSLINAYYNARNTIQRRHV